VVGCLWCPGRWPGKTALEFKRTSDRVRVNIPGQFDQLSFATWVRIEGLNNWFSSLILSDDWDPGEAHWQLTMHGEIELAVCETIEALHDGESSPAPNLERQESPQDHTVWRAKGSDYRTSPILGPSYLGQWVHIATVYDKDHNFVAHYLNGNCVAQKKLRLPIPLRIGSATIGNWALTKQLLDKPPRILNPTRSLNGRIDEFVILQRALSGEEIKQMYELGKPDS